MPEVEPILPTRTRKFWSPQFLLVNDIMQLTLQTERATRKKVLEALPEKDRERASARIDELVEEGLMEEGPRSLRVLNLAFAAENKIDMETTYPERAFAYKKTQTTDSVLSSS